MSSTSSSSSTSQQKRKRKGHPKGPELFSGFGRTATDLLTKGYNKDKRFSVSTYSSENGVVLTSTTERKAKIRTGTVAAQYVYKDAIIDARVDADSKISTVLTVSKPVWPSTKATLSFTFPDRNLSKISTVLAVRVIKPVWPSTKATLSFTFPDHNLSTLKIQYFNEKAALALSTPLNMSPAVKISATVSASPDIAFGVEAVYKTAARRFSQCNAGVSVTQPGCNLSIVLVNKGDLVRLSYLHYLNRSKKVAAVAEASRSFTKGKSSFLVGGTWVVDQQTMVKARVNQHGKVNVLLQYEVLPKSLLVVSGEFNTKALEKTPKIGLALALRI